MKLVETFRVISLIYEMDLEICVNKFIKSILSSDKRNDEYLYFENLIRSLLKVILVDEDFFASCSLFSINYQTIFYEYCNLVQLCSVLLKLINAKVKNEVKGDHVDLLNFRTTYSATSLSGQLQSSDSLKDLSVESKIYLCDSLVNCIMLDLSSYKQFLSQHQAQLANLRSKIARLSKEQHELETNNQHFDIESIRDHSNEVCMKLDEKNTEISDLKKELDISKKEFKYLSRAQEPFGRIEITKIDSNIIEFLYFWYFESLSECLVVEKRVVNPAQNLGITWNCMHFNSEWYLIDNLSTLRFVFNFLSQNLTDSCLTNKILEILTNIEKSHIELDDNEEIILNLEKMKRKSQVDRINKNGLPIIKDIFRINFLNKETLSISRDVRSELFKKEDDLVRCNDLNKDKFEFFQVMK